jgi:hypothetical protein
MARARAKRGRKLTEIADTILAEWYRVLPETSGSAPLQMDVFALTAAFNEILDTQCLAVLDEVGQPIKIVVPLPPVDTRAALDAYVQRNGDFAAGMGAAVIFGCGK